MSWAKIDNPRCWPQECAPSREVRNRASLSALKNKRPLKFLDGFHSKISPAVRWLGRTKIGWSTATYACKAHR
jgi:hypothetical protein